MISISNMDKELLEKTPGYGELTPCIMCHQVKLRTEQFFPYMKAKKNGLIHLRRACRVCFNRYSNRVRKARKVIRQWETQNTQS